MTHPIVMRLVQHRGLVAGSAMIAVLLLLPLVASTAPSRRGPVLGFDWPRVWSGDEPHYLLMLNSLLSDGDLDLRNNYAVVWTGSPQAGRSFAGRPLDHHTKWYAGNRLVQWGQGAAASGPPQHEYSWHPPGLPLLLATFLWPLRSTPWVEPAAIACTALTTIIALAFFCLLIRVYIATPRQWVLAAAVAFLGTPLWPYARTLYCEPYLAACAVGAFALALRRSAFLLAGMLVALGMTMKPPFILMALPLVGCAYRGGGLRLCLRLILPLGIAVVWILSLNYWIHGSFFRSPIQWAPGSFSTGAAGLLLSRTHGLLPMAPAVLPVAAAWPTFLRRYPLDASALLSASAMYFALMAKWIAWDGGACYGPRMIVPVLPLFFAAAAVMPACRWWSFRPARGAAIGACLLSLAFNAVAAFSHGQAWGKHPVDVVVMWLP